MADLDEKLREICERCDVSNNQVTDALGPDAAIAHIKQAFADAGWSAPISGYDLRDEYWEQVSDDYYKKGDPR